MSPSLENFRFRTFKVMILFSNELILMLTLNSFDVFFKVAFQVDEMSFLQTFFSAVSRSKEKTLASDCVKKHLSLF